MKNDVPNRTLSQEESSPNISKLLLGRVVLLMASRERTGTKILLIAMPLLLLIIIIRFIYFKL
jgi:hypothetical protein